MILKYEDTDIGELTLDVCTKLLSLSATYLQIYIDEEYFNLPSHDIGKIRNAMMEVMVQNECRNDVDFGIDDLFEI